MTFLLGPLVVLAFFGAMEAASRLLGLPLSIFGALGAVLRQTDEPRLQRRQALVMLLFVAGVVALGGGAFYMSSGFVSTSIVVVTLVGSMLLTLSGHLGTRTLRAIGRSEAKKRERGE
ncbi:MAG: hypothetical protein JNL96_06970 [Planctomycetaceae bacterium]|nr:hypothetical protein [Planctomycetaceae bacterium]